MSVSTLEKLVVIMHRFGIDYNEFNLKFENIEHLEINFNNNVIDIPDPVLSTWEPYHLILDDALPISSSYLGNGVYSYYNDPGVYPILSVQNPIKTVQGSIIFWASSSIDLGTFALLQNLPNSLDPQIIAFPTSISGYLIKPTSANSLYEPDTLSEIPFGSWGLFVLTQDNLVQKIYRNNLLTDTGSSANLVGTLTFNFYSHILANIAFTNTALTSEQVTALWNAGVTANYKDVLGFTPEAYWRSAPLPGSPSYIANEVF